MIVNITPAKCDDCQEDMSLAPSIGDGATTGDGRPYDWLCLCGSRKFARHLTPQEIQNIGQNVNLVEEVQEEAVQKIIDRQAAIENTMLQRQRQLGRVEGQAQSYERMIQYMSNKGKRTVPKKVVQDCLNVCEAAIKKAVEG